ncbi:DUF2407 C-terminal domain-containing protein [Cladorrhinum sp. PSN332]|nr:DUF2407 C-terminal domain-containing protein [Cladorrhinum sp. PSN332]
MSESSSQNRSARTSGSSGNRLSQEQREPLLAPQPHPQPHPQPPSQSSMPAPQQQPYRITIRFNASLPDIELDIPSPQTTTVVALKHLIRARLAADAQSEPTPPPTSPLPPATNASKARLRFIHGGRILPDASILSAVLKPPPVSSTLFVPDAKGKTPLGQPLQAYSRIFVNCSIGDPLSASELAEEQSLASTIPSSSSLAPSSAPVVPPIPQQHQYNARHNEPRGFDRLAPGMSREEITSLRLTFRNHHAARYTPDNMPSPDQMLELEDAWLDNSSNSTFSPSPENQAIVDDAEAEGWAGNVDNLVIGTAIGFIFPLAVFAWLLREYGMWSRRMQVFVTLGALLSVSIGLVKEMTGGGYGAGD